MLTISPDISWQPVPGEIALFDARDGTYHVLNGTAAAIWRGLAERRSLAEIGTELALRFEAPADLINREIDAFIADARARGLIVETIEAAR